MAELPVKPPPSVDSWPIESWQGPLPELDVLMPGSVDEALEMATAHPEASYLAGGTYLVRFGRWGPQIPTTLIHLGRLSGLRSIESRDGDVFVGGLAVHRQIEREPALGGARVLREAAAEISGPAVRNLATIGGNIVIDWDLVPALLALDARLSVRAPGGDRTVPLDGFHAADGTPDLAAGALIDGVALDTSLPSQAYGKVARRAAASRAIVGVGVALSTSDGTCTEARIGIGGSALTSRRLTDAEEALRGATLDDSAFDAAAEAAYEACDDARDDMEASAWYVRDMTRVMTKRTVRRAAAASR